MADKWFDIEKIKLAMKKAMASPVPFAFGVGGSPAESKLAMHLKREPDFLGRALKKEGFKASRILIGTAETEGSTLVVTCDKEVPKAKKSIKYFLKENQLRQKKVRLMGPNGEFDADDDEDGIATDGEGGTETEEAAETGDQGLPDSAADPRLEELRATAGELSAQIEALSDTATGGKLAGALKSVIVQIDRGNADAAESALTKIQTVLARISPATSAEQGADDQEADEQDDKWTALSAKIEPQIMAALKANHPEAGKIRAVWGFAQEKGAAGDMAAAKQAIKRLMPLLKAVAAPAADAPPTNVVAFQRSRLMWLKAKKDMKTDMEKFKNAVIKQSEDDEDQSDIIKVVDELVEEFGAFDTRLEDILDEITQTPEGPERNRLKKQADNAIGDYLASLETPFFKDIDNNPFVAVNVAGRGKQSLNTVKATLT